MSNVNGEERTEKAAGEEVAVSERSSPLDYTDRGFSAVERWLSYFGMVCLIGLMGMVVVEVVVRYASHLLIKGGMDIGLRPIHGYIDIMMMMMVALVFLTLAYCQREGGHIRMEIFMTRVLKGGRRYHLTEFFHLLISLVAFAMIAFFSVKEVFHAYNIGDVSLTVYLPTWPARMLMAIGSIFLCLRFILQMFQSLSKVVVGVKRTEQ